MRRCVIDAIVRVVMWWKALREPGSTSELYPGGASTLAPVSDLERSLGLCRREELRAAALGRKLNPRANREQRVLETTLLRRGRSCHRRVPTRAGYDPLV